jgi:hypothetical protein
LLEWLWQEATPLNMGELLPELGRAHAGLQSSASALAERFGLTLQSGRWLKTRQPRWQLKSFQVNEKAQWHRLFITAFGYEMAPALWAWKYIDQQGFGVGAYLGKTLVAFYGAIPRAIVFKGKAEMAVQIGDVMVHPNERGILTKHGPFQMVVATFCEQYVGNDKPYFLAFGFPDSRHLLLGKRLGFYEEVDRMVEMSWPITSNHRTWRFYAQVVSQTQKKVVDNLWQTMAAAFTNSVLGVRDWQYINVRYLQHPTVSYAVLLVRQRLSDAPLGLVVLRDRQDHGLELIDLVGLPKHFSSLVRAAKRHAHKLGRTQLFAWLTQSHAHLFADNSCQTTLLDLAVPTLVWSPGPKALEIRDHWLLIGGDTDFR